MPLYEYYCSDCKSKFEMLVSFQHSDDVVCTKCHSEKVRRLLSLFASFRGEGSGEDYDYDADSSTGSCGCGGNCGCH